MLGGFVSKLRSHWRRLLRQHELVLLSMPVAWSRGGLLGSSLRRVQLLATTSRRLLLVDAEAKNMEVVLLMPLDAVFSVDLPNGSSPLTGSKFVLTHGKNKAQLTSLAGQVSMPDSSLSFCQYFIFFHFIFFKRKNFTLQDSYFSKTLFFSTAAFRRCEWLRS